MKGGCLQNNIIVGILLIILYFKYAQSEQDFEHLPDLEYYTRPEYGVIFRPLTNQFIPTDSYSHVFFALEFPEIPYFPEIPPINNEACTEQNSRRNRDFEPTEQEMHKYMLNEHMQAKHTFVDRRYVTSGTPTDRNAYQILPAHLRYEVSQHFDEPEKQNLRKLIKSNRQDICLTLAEQLNTNLDRYRALRNDIIKTHSGLIDLLTANANIPRKNGRISRAIFSFLQPAFSTLFGFATETQVTQVQENLLKLQTNQYAINNDTEKLYDQVSNLANITSRRIDNLWTGIAKLDDNVNKTAHAITVLATDVSRNLINFGKRLEQTHAWSSITLSIHEKAIQLNIDAQMVYNKLGVWTRSLTQLMQQKLPSEIITPYELQKGLAQTKQSLGTRSTSFRLIYDEENLYYYYTQKLAKLFVTQNSTNKRFKLHVHLKIPLATTTIQTKSFQVVILRVPTHSNGSTPGNGYTQLNNHNDYFITSASQISYTELSATDYTFCSSQPDNICPALSLNRDKSDLSCLAAIFFNDHTAIKRKCTFQFFPLGQTPIYAVYVREGLYIIATRSAEITFICTEYNKRTTVAYFAQLRIPCNCAVSSKSLYIPASLANCEQNSQTIYVSHPFNLVQTTMEGFDATQIMKHQRSISMHPPIIQTPRFLDLATITGIKHEDEALELDLESMSIGKQPAKVTFQELSSIDINDSTTIEFIYDIAQFCGLAILYVIVIVLIAKQYRTGIIVATLVTHTEAITLTHPPQMDHADVPGNYNNLPITTTSLLFLFAIAIITLFHLARYALKGLIIRKTKVNSLDETDIFLVYTNLHSSKVVHLLKIYECVTQIKFSTMPAVRECSYRTRWLRKPLVSIIWTHPIEVTILGLTKEIPFPSEIPLPLPLAQLLFTATTNAGIRTLHSQIAITLKAQCACGCKSSKTGLVRIINGHQLSHPPFIHKTVPTVNLNSTNILDSQQATASRHHDESFERRMVNLNNSQDFAVDLEAREMQPTREQLHLLNTGPAQAHI